MPSFDHQRRNFIISSASSLLCVLCGAGLVSSLASCNAVEEGEPVLDLTKETKLQTVGGAVRKRFARINHGEAIFVIRESESRFVAYAAQCTHQGVELQLPKNGMMKCPNHGSQFRTLNGMVLDGPAYAPLRSFIVQYDEQTHRVTIS